MSRERRQYGYIRLAAAAIPAAWLIAFSVLGGMQWRAIASAQAVASCDCGVAAAIPWPLQVSWGLSATIGTAVAVVWLATLLQIFFRQRRWRSGFGRTVRRIVHQPTGLTYWLTDDQGTLAVTTGWFRPTVIIGLGLVQRLTKTELTSVLRHEAVHVRRRDPFWTALIESIVQTAGRPGWLVAWAMQAYSLRELTADAGATRDYRDIQPLGGALVKMMPTVPNAVVGFSPNQARIEKLINPLWSPSFSWWSRNARRSVAAIAVASFGLLTIIRATAATVPNTPIACPADVQAQMCARPAETRPSIVCFDRGGWTCLQFGGPMSGYGVYQSYR